ncbi:MAG: hypothetical protein KC636_24925, partial [Myxococcales bacterium]|nr:hypothetical protein [Myxococcales bacterium]
MSSHGPTAESLDRDQIHIKAGSLWRRLPLIGLVLAVLGAAGLFMSANGAKARLHNAESALHAATEKVQQSASPAVKARYTAALEHHKALKEEFAKLIAAERQAAEAWEMAAQGGNSVEAKKAAKTAESASVKATAAVVRARAELADADHEGEELLDALAESAGAGVAEEFKSAKKEAALAHANEQQFWFSYLVAYMFFLAISLGGLFFTIIQHLVRAGWSIVVRRLAENVMITLPLMGLLGLPFILLHDAPHALFHWTHLDAVEADLMLASKAGYLNLEFFNTRLIVYFLVWTALSLFFYTQSTSQDSASGDAALHKTLRMRWFAPLSLLFFAVTTTFAAFDLMMSLDPHWFSTMFGVYYFAGLALTSNAVLTIIVYSLHRSGYLKGVVTVEHYHDLGKLMFGFTVFWTYIGFSQYFLIWYANIPEETGWFGYRIMDDFLPLSQLVIFGRFVLPFFYLLRRPVKRNPQLLILAAVFIVFMELVDVYWLIQPALAHSFAQETGSHHMEMVIGGVDYLALLTIGGAFLAVFGWALARRALVPVKDPRLTESL